MTEHIKQVATLAIIKTPDGYRSMILTLPRPNRHHHLHRTRRWHDIIRGRYGELVNEIQGFLTTHDAFVDRKWALSIARQHGQILKKHGSPNELFSEDVWESGDPDAFIIGNDIP